MLTRPWSGLRGTALLEVSGLAYLWGLLGAGSRPLGGRPSFVPAGLLPPRLPPLARGLLRRLRSSGRGVETLDGELLDRLAPLALALLQGLLGEGSPGPACGGSRRTAGTIDQMLVTDQ